MNESKTNLDIEDIEIQLLIDAIFMKYGYDFRNYSRAHMKRRIMNRLRLSNFQSVSHMQYQILRDEALFEAILPDFSINVTEMFRDPVFFAQVREMVVPLLKTYPNIKIWHAGCSSGEEVYSMAILLKEEGLLDRCQIYATDFNENILQVAKDGIYPLEVAKEYTSNYIASNGVESFSDYYTAKYDSIILDHSLKKNIVFAEHNLVTDGVFGQMHLILCRNVLIYFDKFLQEKVYNLFDESLRKGGFLCLGTKESLAHSPYLEHFDTLNFDYRIYRKKIVF